MQKAETDAEAPELQAPEPRSRVARDAGGAAWPRGAEGIRTLAALEAEAILTAVRLCDGNMSEAARRLGIGRSTLYRKLAALQAAGGTGAPRRPGPHMLG